MSTATLNDLHATSASVNIPAYGCWFAKVALDGEHDIARGSRVTLKIADATFSGTVLSGGAAKGRSAYRIVAGAGGWGRPLKKKAPYANDAGVKVATVLGDAALEVGETLAPIDPALRLGPAWARPEDPGSRLLEQIAPGAWYVDEAGTTRLGQRAPGTLPAGVTHGPVDRARGTVTLASEQIASILPGLVVDGLVVVDVLHEVSAKSGLRSTVWGATGGRGTSRDLETLRRLFEQLDPLRRFRGVTEYRIESREGKRLNLQPVKRSSGMPDLARVPVRPGVAGCDAELEDGAHVLVAFANSDPSGAFVMCGAELEDELFQPSTLNLLAGGQLGAEHVATVEGMVLFVYNAFASVLGAAPPGPITGATLLPLIGPKMLLALAAQTAAAPAGQTAQVTAAAAQLATFATGAPATTSSYFKSAIDAVSSKTPNASGLFPSLGAAAVETG